MPYRQTGAQSRALLITNLDASRVWAAAISRPEVPQYPLHTSLAVFSRRLPNCCGFFPLYLFFTATLVPT
jgi:hypothetical protein